MQVFPQPPPPHNRGMPSGALVTPPGAHMVPAGAQVMPSGAQVMPSGPQLCAPLQSQGMVQSSTPLPGTLLPSIASPRPPIQPLFIEPVPLPTDLSRHPSSCSLPEQPNFESSLAFTPSPSASSTSPGVSREYQSCSQEDSSVREGLVGVSRKRRSLRQQKTALVVSLGTRSVRSLGNC